MNKINSGTLNYCYSLHVVCAARSICASFCCWNKYILNNCFYCVMECHTYTSSTSVFLGINFTGSFTHWCILYLKVYTMKKYSSRESTSFFLFPIAISNCFSINVPNFLHFKNQISTASDSLLSFQHNMSLRFGF